MQIDQGLKGLYATGLFQDVRIRQASGEVIVTRSTRSSIASPSNTTRSTKDEQLASGAAAGARHVSRPLVQADTQRLVEIYRRSGRFDVTVTPKIIERTMASISFSKSTKARRPASPKSVLSAIELRRSAVPEQCIKTSKIQFPEF